MASAPAAPVLIASTSPRRRQVLGQLRIPSGAVVRPYEETEDDPVAHALGKDRSLLAEADGRPVRGCGTEIFCGGRVYTSASESTIPLAEFGRSSSMEYLRTA